MNSFARLSSLLFAALVPCSALACASASNNTEQDLGDVTAGAYTVHVLQEGVFKAGVTTKFAIKPAGSTPKPDSVACWYGAETAEASTHITASYDANDKDFDCLVPVAQTIAGTDKLWFALTYGTQTTNGSVATKP